MDWDRSNVPIYKGTRHSFLDPNLTLTNINMENDVAVKDLKIVHEK